MKVETVMHPPRDLPAYFHGASKDRRETARTREMAEHFSRVMIETGFSERDVALAFMQVGMSLSQQIDQRDGEPDVSHHVCI